VNRIITVLCVDDNPEVAEAIKLALQSVPDIEFVGCLSEAGALVDEACRTSPDVVLLDIDMPGKNPFEAMNELSGTCPDVRVLMYSGHIRMELIDRALENGAWGYVAKSDELSALLAAIRRAARGEFTLSPSVETVYGRPA
jgi:DNA-binding NarL/FixJ family response regulator